MRGALARLFACGMVGTLSGAWNHPVHADTSLAVGIPPQPADAALTEFAHQTGLQLVFVSQVAQAQVSKGARAGLAPAAALTELLDGTGLSFEFLNARTVRIFAAAAVPAAPPSSVPTSPPRRARSNPIDEVIVSAWRDLEQSNAAHDLQTVPDSISVLSGASLRAKGLEQLGDYASYIPGMNVVPGGMPGQAYVIIRGIQPFTDGAPVAYYLDDVPIGGSGPWANASGLPLDLLPYDLERFEVLRGPQGTLYGAGSEAGVVQYVLKRPNLSEFGASVGADLNAIHNAAKPGESLRATANVPIVEGALAVRAGAYGVYTPGYIDNLYSGASGINVLRQYGGRLAALWQPDETFSVRVSALWYRIRGGSASQIYSVGAAIMPHAGAAYFSQPIGTYPDLDTDIALLEPQHKTLDLYSATARWTPSAIDIVSTTAWSRSQADSAADVTSAYVNYYPLYSGGAVPAGLALSDRQLGLRKFSEELHILSPRQRRIEWMLGGFYTDERASDLQSTYALDKAYQPIAFFAPGLGLASYSPTYRERALFGDLTWHLGARLDLSAGIRYAHNNQEFTSSYSAWNVPILYDFGQSSESATTWMASAASRVTPQMMLYARVATGSQPGGPQGTQPGIPPTVKAETVLNYEVGLKGGSLDERALIDLAVFYLDWKDVQISAYNSVQGFFLGFFSNAGRANSQGVELTSSYSPLQGLRLAYNATYTQCEFISVSPDASYVLTGYQLANVPKWNMAATADYDWTLTARWRAHVGGGVRWIDRESSGYVALQTRAGYPAVVLPSYAVLDLNAGIVKGALSLRVYVRNLSDMRANLQSVTTIDAVTNTPVQISSRYVQPRTLGFGFDYAF
jgi:iron complex outermembrane recepter protein